MHHRMIGSLVTLLCLLLPLSALALAPAEILLISNRNQPQSLQLARYYQQQRKIPTENLLQIALPTTEDCSRSEYQQQLVAPLRTYLREHPGQIRCLLLFYGVPLRVAAPELSHEQWQAVEQLKFDKRELDWKIKNRPQAEELPAWRSKLKALQLQLDRYQKREESAAVDSELALAQVANYPLQRWQKNPYFVGFSQQQLPLRKVQVLLVARLDGPTPEIVRRLIDDSLMAEKEGLQGKAYFDARWPLPDPQQQLQGYALYDASLHRAAAAVGKLSHLPVVLDQQEALFGAGSAPQAALYSGWYSLGKYVDAFAWQPGAVAYHIASSECTTLKKAGSQVWCKRLLEEGVAATIGPVAEPYVQGFPLPEIFFRYLLDGYYTLAESYFLSLPFLSWRMLLIGDPLYRPFRYALQTD